LFIWHDPRRPGDGQQIEGAQIMDIAPSILRALGVGIPPVMQGHARF
jgi:bisphosphoglycerate-independent phosphoglycerate mutase (AlkP superfamily)